MPDRRRALVRGSDTPVEAPVVGEELVLKRKPQEDPFGRLIILEVGRLSF